VDVLLGLLAAPLGVALLLLVNRLAVRTERSRVPLWLRPAIAELCVGLIGLLLPRVLGSGESGIEEALGGRLAVELLLVLPFAKLLATTITLGSGAIGGVFTPSLFIGAAFGGLYGAGVAHFWSGAGPMGGYALVGMGTVVAAAVNAPLTAVLLVSEFTRGFSLLPEIVAAVAASVTLARFLHAESIYTLPLRLRGFDRALLRRSPLAGIRVREVMATSWPVIEPDRSLRQAIALARATGRAAFPVVHSDGRYAGVLSLDAVTVALDQDLTAGQPPFQDRPVRELILEDVPQGDPDDSLHDVALLLGGSEVVLPLVPVVARAEGRYVGVLERTVVLRSYSAAARLQQRAGRRAQ
jgi:CIC family chloride channel protein